MSVRHSGHGLGTARAASVVPRHVGASFAARACGGGAGDGSVRFETSPGRQLQIDCGQRRIAVDGLEQGRVYLFVATLGYLRRIYAQAFPHERQSAWLGIEGAFHHFGGLPLEWLLDNAKAWSSATMQRRVRWSSTTGFTRLPSTGTCDPLPDLPRQTYRPTRARR